MPVHRTGFGAVQVRPIASESNEVPHSEGGVTAPLQSRLSLVVCVRNFDVYRSPSGSDKCFIPRHDRKGVLVRRRFDNRHFQCRTTLAEPSQLGISKAEMRFIFNKGTAKVSTTF